MAASSIHTQSLLHSLPKFARHNPFMLPRITVLFVANLSDMNRIRQQFIQGFAREAAPSGLDTFPRDPDLRYDPALVEFPAELPDAAKFQVSLIDVPDRLCFGRIDDQPSLRTSYPSGGTPPIHMPLRLEAAILSQMRSPVTSRSN